MDWRDMAESAAIEAARAADYAQHPDLTAQAMAQLADIVGRGGDCASTPDDRACSLDEAVAAWVEWGRGYRASRLASETVILRSPHGVRDQQVCLSCAMQMQASGVWPTDALGDEYAPVRYADAGLCGAERHGLPVRGVAR